MRSTADSSRHALAGWGRTVTTETMVSRPVDAASLCRWLKSSPGGVIARGLGRSYGDAAQCGGGLTLDMTGFDHIGTFDDSVPTIDVGGGVSLHELMRTIIPRGWFVPVTPGTRYVTVGGAIAADVHGKNHHKDGSFCRHISELTLVTPTGLRTVSPDRNAELFWATAGGMGLTGLIVSARIRLIPLATSWMKVDSQRFNDLAELMSTMERTDDLYRYTVAWLDCTGGRPGRIRSVLTRGDHASSGDIPGRLWSRSREVPREPSFGVGRRMPRRVLGAAAIRALNTAWFRTSSDCQGDLRSLTEFFHPLDGVRGWNLLYGPRGFVQYQFAVPPGRGDVIEHVTEEIASAGFPSFLAVLKRFGPGTPGPLSFSQEGWTLALDFPLGPPGLAQLLDCLDETVAGAGGRVYLAKDARVRPELLPLMYPRLNEWIEICRRVDPAGSMASDLSRRLALTS
jgi:decaprenylphospho-beta-D-ribofuranose 2-oxidase